MLANLDLAWKALSASPILTDLVSRLRESNSGSDIIPSPSREAALRAIDHLTRWSGAWEYFANTPFEVSGIRISKDLLAAAVQKQIIQGLVEVSHLEERILRFYPSLFPQVQQRELENIKTSFERAKTTHADPHVALRIADRLFTMSGAYE